MICPQCKSENRDHAKFCDQCGTSLAAFHDSSEPIDGADVDLPTDSVSSQSEASIDAAQAIPVQLVETPGVDAAKDESDSESVSEPLQEEDETFVLSSSAEQDTDINFCQDAFLDETDSADNPGQSIETAEQGDVSSCENTSQRADCQTLEDGDECITELNNASKTQKLTPDITLNLSDLGVSQQEQVVGSEYQLPESMWHTGDTMKFPKISEEAAKGRDFRAPDPEEMKRRRRRRCAIVAGVVVAVLIVAGVIFATYEMQLWGGKKVPQVVGLAQSEASALLEESGFSVRSQEIPSDDDEGIVLLSDPTQGSRVDEGSVVYISISAARTIPDVIGMGQEAALAALNDLGYENISVIEEKSDNPQGSVLAISEEVGSKVFSNVPITLTVAQPYLVPDVIGLDEQDARSAVEEAGYVCDVEYVYDSGAEGTVSSTEPQAETQLNSGQSVIVYVSKSIANTLIQATRSIVYPGNIVIVNEKTYAISSVRSVSYVGSNTTSYTFVGNQVVTLLGQSIPYSYNETVSGQLVWTDDGTLSYGNPSFKY